MVVPPGSLPLDEQEVDICDGGGSGVPVTSINTEFNPALEGEQWKGSESTVGSSSKSLHNPSLSFHLHGPQYVVY